MGRDLAELLNRATLLRSHYPGDPNQYYDLSKDASEQWHAYYHVGYNEAHGLSAIDLSMDRQQGNRDSRPRVKKPAVVPEEQADSAIKSSDGPDCLTVGVSVYGRQSGKQSAAPRKRKRPQPASDDESDFESPAHKSDTLDSHTSTSPSHSLGSLSATANSSINFTRSLSCGPKPESSSHLPAQVIVNPRLSFATANGGTISGDVRKVIDEMLPGIQQAMASYTEGAITQCTKTDREMEPVTPMTEPTVRDKSVQAEFSITNAAVQAALPTMDVAVQAEVQITDMVVQTETPSRMQSCPHSRRGPPGSNALFGLR